jgi:hypothetical protein
MMQMRAVLLLGSLAVGFSGCCSIKSIEIEPQISNIDLQSAKIDSAYAKVKFELNQCCPNKQQRETIAFLEAQTRNLYVQLVNNQITLNQYNAKIAAAKRAIEGVVLHCSVTPKPQGMASGGSDNQGRISSASVNEMTPQEAWENLDKVTQSL